MVPTMIQSDLLSRMLSDVYLNGVIKECVIVIKENVAYVNAIDMTTSIFVQAKTPAELEDGKMGISDINLLIKCLNFMSGAAVKATKHDNRLEMVPKKGSKVNYLLSEVDLIPTYKEELDNVDVIEDELEDGDYLESVPLTETIVSEIVQSIALLGHNSVVLTVNKRGHIAAHSGTESEHQSEVFVGKVENKSPFSIKFYSTHLTNILNRIDFTKEPKLYLSKTSPLIVITESSSWMLQPISGNPEDDVDAETKNDEE